MNERVEESSKSSTEKAISSTQDRLHDVVSWEVITGDLKFNLRVLRVFPRLKFDHTQQDCTQIKYVVIVK